MKRETRKSARTTAIERRHKLGLAAWDAGRIEEAIDHFRKVVALAPDSRQGHVNLAQVLLLSGDLPAGFHEMGWLWPSPRSPKYWDGRQLRGGNTVVLHYDEYHGFGDAIQFVRYVPLVAAQGARVVLIVPPALHRLMTTVRGVAEVISCQPMRLPLQYHQRPLMSLPEVFGTTLETIPSTAPYLHADPSPWSDFLGGLPGLKKVGLVWAGKSRTGQPDATEMDARRSMRLADMTPILSTQGCSFVSLQLGPPAAQMRALPPSLVLHDVSARMKDWADTAGLIMGLDLVITVDTAVAHLAGALGKPVWLLNRYDTCWRWMCGRHDSPWYPTMRLFRQTRPGDWTAPIAEAAAELRRLIHEKQSPLLTWAANHHQGGRLREAEQLYGIALTRNPNDAAALHLSAGLAMQRGDHHSAIALERQAVSIDPRPEHVGCLGSALYAADQIPEALHCLQSAIEMGGNEPLFHCLLGTAKAELNDPAGALPSLDRAIALRPGYGQAHTARGIVLEQLGRCDDAISAHRAAVRAMPGNVAARAALAEPLLASGLWAEGFAEFEHRQLYALPGRRWHGEYLTGQTIFLHAERGFGDVIQFSRYIPLVAARAGRVVLAVPARLKRLFTQFNNVEVVSDLKTLPAYDCHCPLMSLALAFYTTTDSVPSAAGYLRANPASWSDFLSTLPGKKIGLRWTAKAWPEREARAFTARRSTALTDLAPLRTIAGVSWVSLEIEPEAYQGRLWPELHDVAERQTDWQATAELVAGLDLIISVDTSVAHLGGALGVPTWILLPTAPCWRWLRDREDTPWYRSARLFRQQSPKDWPGVIASVKRELEQQLT